MRRYVLLAAAAVVAVLAVSLVADALIPPASAGAPSTLYVDRRIGADSNDGRAPERALESFGAALRKARPGADILLTGYGSRLAYKATGTRCVTLVGTAERPITIRRNIYTNTLYPAMITATRTVRGPWRQVSVDGEYRVWAADWPNPIRLSGDPDNGFVKLGEIALLGYPSPPPLSAGNGAWWQDGKVFIRHDHYDPNEFPVLVKDGDGICLSGQSRHVRIEDLMVAGAVHAIRVEPGAVDVRIKHIFRQNVLDDDLVAGSLAR